MRINGNVTARKRITDNFHDLLDTDIDPCIQLKLHFYSLASLTDFENMN